MTKKVGAQLSKILASPIGRKLTVLVLAFSSALTLIGTAQEIYIDYQHDRELLDSRVEQIRSSHLDSLATTIWTLDSDRLREQLDGIARLPAIARVRVAAVDELMSMEVKTGSGTNTLHYHFPIVYRRDSGAQPLGSLEVDATLDEIHARVRHSIVRVLFTQGVKSLLVSFFILAIFHYFVTRHLVAIGDYVERVSLSRNVSPLRLARRKGAELDEIDRVALALNSMQTSIAESYAKMDALNRAKEEFLLTLSHELRSPLHAMVGWTNVLERSTTDQATLDKAITTIRKHAHHLTTIVEDLLDVSESITGSIVLVRESVDVYESARAVVSLCEETARARGVSLTLEGTRQGTAVRGDPKRITQILWNLISNAIKFTPPGGAVRVLMLSETDSIKVVVCDTGKGIDPKIIDRVFERFFQEEGGSTRRFGGLGLGLALVKELVELHGGTISVKSAGLNKGATFTVNLPRCESTPR